MAGSDTFDTFHRLIKKGDLLGIREFVESGAEVNYRNATGWTPLMWAAHEGNVPIIEYLLSKGADVSAVNYSGVSALACAGLEGECRAIEVLLAAGASVDVRPHGASLLEYVKCGGGRFKTQRHVKLLEAAGAQ
jgi:ankyrin repeat protein